MKTSESFFIGGFMVLILMGLLGAVAVVNSVNQYKLTKRTVYAVCDYAYKYSKTDASVDACQQARDASNVQYHDLVN